MKINKIWICLWILVLVISLGISNCSAPAKLVAITSVGETVHHTDTADPPASPTRLRPVQPTSTLPFLPTMTFLPTWTVTATQTPTPTLTQTPTPTLTNTPVPTPTATWVFNKAGKVIAPILLYHHISDINPDNRYYVSPTNFHAQMQALRDWGFTSITPAYFRKVLVEGGDLPARPVVITFDDGNLDVYENAFPIMREYGLIGAFYIVSNNIGAKDYVGVDELKEMAAGGWEIGSHTKDHKDLTINHDLARDEMLQSRLDIQKAISVTVTSIAYPYGLVDEFIATKAQDYGYLTGMGLGISTEHTWGTMYYLNRREVHGDMDLTAFANLLPWSDPLITDTPTSPNLITSTPESTTTPDSTPTAGGKSP